MFQGGIMSGIIPHERQICICALAWKHHLTYWCFSPPTALSQNTICTIVEPMYPHRAYVILSVIQSLILIWVDMFHNPCTWGRIVWLRTVNVSSSCMHGLRLINLQGSCHSFFPPFSYCCVRYNSCPQYWTLVLLRKNGTLDISSPGW